MVRVQGDIKSFLHNQLVIWTNLYHFDSAWISRPSPEKKEMIDIKYHVLTRKDDPFVYGTKHG